MRDDIFQEARLAIVQNWDKSSKAGSKREDYLAVCALRAVDELVRKWRTRAFLPASLVAEWHSLTDELYPDPQVIAMFREELDGRPPGRKRAAPCPKRMTVHQKQLLVELLTVHADWSDRRIAKQFQRRYRRPLDKATVNRFRQRLEEIRRELHEQRLILQLPRPKQRRVLTGVDRQQILNIATANPGLSCKQLAVKAMLQRGEFISRSAVAKIISSAGVMVAGVTALLPYLLHVLTS